MVRGGVNLLKALKEEADKQDVHDVRIQSSGCLGPCEVGATIVVYGRDSEPDGIWYKQVTLNDVPDLVSSQLKNGNPVERLRHNWEPVQATSGINLSL
jgi:(2Fe-2S) ferredoxin